MTYAFGIDISKYQGVNDYAKMRANTAFVFVKATESWGYTDPKFYANWTGLIGHNRGAYSFVWLSDDPLRQANHLTDIVTQAGVDWKYDRLVLDLEKSGHGLSKAEVSRRVLVMMERIKEVTGRYPILYSRKYWVQDNMLVTDPRLINADWWLAYYRTALPYPLYTPEMPPPPLLPTGVSKWLFHQTCEKGNGREVGVGSYYVDQNRFNGTKDQLDAYFGRGDYSVYLPIVTVPEPEPEPKPLYSAKVKPIAPDRLNVRRTPNGQIVRKLYAGDIVGVYQDSAGWSRIGVGEWIMSRYIQPLVDEGQVADGLLDVELWSQQDIRWGNDRMGSSAITLKQGGCLVTAVSSYLNFLGIDTDPKRYNALLGSRGGYMYVVENGVKYANMYWKMPDYLWRGQVERAEYQGFSYGQGWETLAQSILDSGRPALAHVDFIPGGSVQQHWVLIVGERDGSWWAVDPETGALISLSKYENKVYRIVGYRRK